jgi:SAM-dependent methyltransferase
MKALRGRAGWRGRAEAAERRRLVAVCCAALFDGEVDERELRQLGDFSNAKGTGALLRAILRSDWYCDRVFSLLTESPLSDEQLVAALYRKHLGREPDEDGFRRHTSALAAGVGRADLVGSVVTSEEGINFALKRVLPLQDLTKLRPEAFVEAQIHGTTQQVLCYRATCAEDLDWMEGQILENEFYDVPGVWTLEMDEDKQRLGSLIRQLEPATVLEIGCSSGTVLECLAGYGIAGVGVDISSDALARAAASIRDNLRCGDLLDLPFDQEFDVVYGLDVFEHLNPNRMNAYLSRIAALVRPGGYVFANIPAFGDDEQFGMVLDMYLDEWVQSATRRELFDLLQVDRKGYPLHGHLGWAHTSWWVSQFESAGLTRVPGIEAALHSQFDEVFLQLTPSRVPFYVFARAEDRARSHEIAQHIAARQAQD